MWLTHFLDLSSHKANQFYKGTEIYISKQSVADPVSLLQSYVTRRDALHGAVASLFVQFSGEVPDRNWFDNRFHAALSRDFGGTLHVQEVQPSMHLWDYPNA